MTLTNDLSNLKEELNQLKQAYSNPQIYIWTHYNTIQNEIDLSANQCLAQHELNELEEKQLIDNWLLMIDQVKLITIESISKFQNGLANKEIEADLNQIENKLIQNVNLFEITHLINETWTKLERILFLNKTILFIDKEAYLKSFLTTSTITQDSINKDVFSVYYKFNLFNQMTSNILFGKLFILNEYFNKQIWHIFKYNQSHTGELKSEIIKLKEVKQTLEFNTTSNLIEEISVKIESIRLNDNKLDTISCGLFDEFSQVRSIHLSCNSLTQLNDNIFGKLECLTEIWLNHNRLSHLPANIFKNLINLEKLDLQFNEFTKFEPGLFSGLKELKKLWLSNNNLEFMDSEMFKNLTNLTHLYFTNNKLKTLESDSFKYLTNLEECWLSYNKITELPGLLFRNTTKLEKLILDSNEICHLDDAIFINLSNLTHLFIGYNQLASLSFNLFKKTNNLIKLSLDNNKLKCLDSSLLNHLDNLSEIRFNSNQIDYLSEDIFVSNSKLRVVYLRNNKLTSLPSHFVKFTLN